MRPPTRNRRASSRGREKRIGPCVSHANGKAEIAASSMSHPESTKLTATESRIIRCVKTLARNAVRKIAGHRLRSFSSNAERRIAFDHQNAASPSAPRSIQREPYAVTKMAQKRTASTNKNLPSKNDV